MQTREIHVIEAEDIKEENLEIEIERKKEITANLIEDEVEISASMLGFEGGEIGRGSKIGCTSILYFSLRKAAWPPPHRPGFHQPLS